MERDKIGHPQKSKQSLDTLPGCGVSGLTSGYFAQRGNAPRDKIPPISSTVLFITDENDTINFLIFVLLSNS